MERIESERLYLRPFGHGDAEAVWAYRSLAEVARYQYWEPYTPDYLFYQFRCIIFRT